MIKTEKSENLVVSTYNTLTGGILVTILSCMLLLGNLPLTLPVMVATIVGFLVASFSAVFKPNLITFSAYSIMTGVLLSLSLLYVELSVIYSSAIMAGVVFVLLTLYVNVTGKDFSHLGETLFYLLLALIIAMVVNIFLGSDVMDTLISAAGVLIFSGLILFDTSELRKGNFENKYQAATALHLNIINLFLHIVSLSED